MKGTAPLLVLLIFLVTLTGCASPPAAQPSPVKCPEPVVLPSSLTSSDLPAAQTFSSKVRNFYAKVQTWLDEQQPTKKR